MSKHDSSGTRPPGPRRAGGAMLLGVVVLGVTLACAAAFIGLLLRPQVDIGSRVWLLNHAPDQVAVIDPFRRTVEKQLPVSDGLRGLTFSRDGKRCYVFGVVDVTNKLTVMNTLTALEEDKIELDGIPQGIAVFPNDEQIAVILGAKTDFMSGGFDVLDLSQRSKADESKRVNLMRVRDLQLSHKIAVGDDGDRIYMIDAKDSRLFVYSLKEQRRIREVDLGGAPEDFIYPYQGDYYYASVLQHLTIYQISKETDEIVAGYVYADIDPRFPYRKSYLRKMAVDSSGRYLYATSSERHGVGIWDLGNPEYLVQPDFRAVQMDRPFPRLSEFPHYVPTTRFRVRAKYRADDYTPQPQLIETDPLGTYLFVVDEYGALYIYNHHDIFVPQPPTMAEPADLPVPEPEGMVLDLANETAEVRDIAVSQPQVRGAAAGARQ